MWENTMAVLTLKSVIKNLKKKQTLWPLFIDGVQLPQG